ncbi:cytochrome C oxidase subunit II [Fredinandcohnia quinoae]|uniref:Cytochrome aa3 subunit 2 n=1 Tax=Fredinandcohnia quinoae TaxID=2918902 RepID=A0AAW5E2T1_9BACI|nr:cytochrome C oxidase subunit II [Fredinandcohnia sp. SECRCQ15]MCH1625859.1 cytochrome C oxidase subunit II [Fredinandcohnia sp. SECRCQ15]
MYQTLAWYVSLILMIFIVGVFLFVVLNTARRKDYEPIQKKWYRFRNIYFVALLIIMGTVSYFTLSDLPFERPVYGADENPVIVDVKAIQFGWNLSQTEFKVGEPIEFDITSEDVNHGFGLYDESMTLLAQTQAMPNYTNTVFYTFDKPGTYQILCMEYCGLAHHIMIGEITVTE